MNRFLLLIIVLFSVAFVFGQQPGTFVIKGKTKNPPQDFYDLGVSDLIGQQLVSLPIDKEGNFFKTITIEYPQDFFVHLDKKEDGVLLFAVPGDTIELNWDCKNFVNTLQVKSPKADRQTELDLMWALSKKFLSRLSEMMDTLSQGKLNDSLKFQKVKAYFQNQVQLALSYPLTQNSRKIFGDLYYRSLTILYQLRLLPKYSLSLRDVLPKTICDALEFVHTDAKHIDERLFYVSDSYRSFIFNQVRLPNGSPAGSFKSFSTLVPTRETPNYTLSECCAGVTSLALAPTVLDWFLAKAIMDGFGHYNFEGSEQAYMAFHSMIKYQQFRDTLEHFYNNFQRLKPGKQAPVFTLKNEKNLPVSLNDFKGKVVFIDFWGKYCGPCRYDIANYVPKLHEKYKGKNVVFLNICVDVSGKEWQEAINQLKLGGINLVAPGWTVNSVCKDYNVNSIPHYVLIDTDGKIVQNNADRPWQLLDPVENPLDKILK